MGSRRSLKIKPMKPTSACNAGMNCWWITMKFTSVKNLLVLFLLLLKREIKLVQKSLEAAIFAELVSTRFRNF